MSASTDHEAILDDVYQNYFVDNKDIIRREIDEAVIDAPSKRVHMVTVEARTNSVEIKRSEQPQQVIQDYFPTPDDEDMYTDSLQLDQPNKTRVWNVIIVLLSVLLVLCNTTSLILTIYYFVTIGPYPGESIFKCIC
jgi:hypothetical protein